MSTQSTKKSDSTQRNLGITAKRKPKDETAAEKPVQAVIENHPFLAGLNASHLKILTENSMRMRFEPGELIFREGDPANRFYLIEQGKVSLESVRKNEQPVRIQLIGSGDVLGWSWLFPPYYWHFDAVAVEPTTAIFLYGSRLRENCEQDHDLGYELIKRMAAVVIGRLQVTRKQLMDARG